MEETFVPCKHRKDRRGGGREGIDRGRDLENREGVREAGGEGDRRVDGD